ncbi:MAG: hypothetical protein ABIS68_09335 [Casimicrobiaceae bacterium]
MGKISRFIAALLLAASAPAMAQLTDTTIVTNRASIAPNAADWTDVYVDCPAGSVALSGGIDTPNFSMIEITTLAPTFAGGQLAFVSNGVRAAPDGWYASVKNFDTVSHPVALAAVCATVSGAQAVVASSTVTAGSASAPGMGTASATCPVGYSGVGGGSDVTQPASMKLSSNAPVFGSQFLIQRPAGTGPAPTGWTASVRSEGVAGTIKVAVVCAQLSGVSSVSTGGFTVASKTVTGVSATCPAGSIALGGGIDTNEITFNAIAVSTPFFPSAPQFPADRATGTYGSAAGWYGIFYNYGPGSTTGAVGAICLQATPGVVIIYEFYNTNLKHYFRTSSAAEADAIDHGSAGPGWVRTGDNFFAYAAGTNNPGSDVCRFYTFGANSHFYTAFPAECASLKDPNSGWTYEGLSFRIPLPTNSNCGGGTQPIYRLYNNRFQFTDSNHRFTSLSSQIPVLQAQGWTYEGVAFCAPTF